MLNRENLADAKTTGSYFHGPTFIGNKMYFLMLVASFSGLLLYLKHLHDNQDQPPSFIDRVPHFYPQLKAYFSHQNANMDTFNQSFSFTNGGILSG